MTELPPAKTASWYRRERACALCIAKVMNRVERPDGGAAIRVLHEESCSAFKRGSRTSTVQRDKPAQVADQPAPPPTKGVK